jgi:hypothetical protein
MNAARGGHPWRRRKINRRHQVDHRFVQSQNPNNGNTKEYQHQLADKEHIAWSISSQDVFDLADNAQLGIGGSLPAPNADVGLCEKLISDCLELVWEQEARRRSGVLVHRLTHLYLNVQLCGNSLGCLNRLPPTTGDDLRCT